jgi:hypothetical protein
MTPEPRPLTHVGFPFADGAPIRLRIHPRSARAAGRSIPAKSRRFGARWQAPTAVRPRRFSRRGRQVPPGWSIGSPQVIA